jgi:hypothetical protein
VVEEVAVRDASAGRNGPSLACSNTTEASNTNVLSAVVNGLSRHAVFMENSFPLSGLFCEVVPELLSVLLRRYRRALGKGSLTQHAA